MNRISNFKLSIPEPCSQTWNDMSQTDQGRFCENCSKSVRDFANFSDQQLKDFFSKNTGKICGSFAPNQIDRFLGVQEKSIRRRLIPQFLVSAVLTIGLVNEGKSKEIGNQIHYLQKANKSQAQPELKEAATSTGESPNFISGKIIDCELKESIPSVTISIKGTNYIVDSDVDGKFKIFVPDSLVGQEITLVFTYLGYENKEMQASTYNLPLKTVVRLNSSVSRLTGDVLITKKPTLWEKIFKKKEKVHVCK